jgi:DeoR family transcriptional regulator, carbon catabolite repression regulator
MLKEKRFEFILDSLKKKRGVTFEDLAARLSVSDDTIRRDIEYLHKNGLLSKVRGGAIPRAKNPLTFQDRQSYLKKEKDVIALKTQQLLQHGMTVFMDGGTTMCAIAEYLPADIRLRVVTNNYSLVGVLAPYQHVELIVAGGNYERRLQSFSGHATCSAIADFTADLYLMGTCGVHQRFGVSGDAQLDAEVKRAMKKAARATAVLANHENLRRVDAFKVCDITEIDILVTDLNTDHEDLDEFRDLDIQLL